MEDFYTLSDAQLVKRIGNKIKSVRLKRNITQQSLAEASSISVSSLKKIESGEIGTFDSLLRVLRTLGMLESISTLFEEEQMSPSEYYEMVNKAKTQTLKRAVGQIKTDKEVSEWEMWQRSDCSDKISEHLFGMILTELHDLNMTMILSAKVLSLPPL